MVPKRDETRIAARVAKTLKDRVDQCGTLIGSNESDIVRLCLEAFCNYVEKNQSSPFPCLILPQASFDLEIEAALERIRQRKLPLSAKKSGARDEDESNYPGDREMID